MVSACLEDSHQTIPRTAVLTHGLIIPLYRLLFSRMLGGLAADGSIVQLGLRLVALRF